MTEQTNIITQANMLHSAYKVAHEDRDFLTHEDQRGVRMMLEYQKVEAALRAMNIESTIVVFGSARVLSPEDAEQALISAKTPEERAMAEIRVKQAPWYTMARDFGRIASQRGGALINNPGEPRRNVIASGGGPSLMAAACQGATIDAGAPAIGFNITLPFEQAPNPYSTPELTFLFKFFSIRKMHLALRLGGKSVNNINGINGGLICMPGGYGTFDEIYEVLNLICCDKMPEIPIVLFDREFWNKTCNFQYLLEQGLISKRGIELISYADSAEEGWQIMEDRSKIIAARRN